MASSEIPKAFKAWQYKTSGKPSEVLHLIDDYSLPSVQGFPIIVKVHAAALNPVGYKVMSDMPSFVTKRPAVPEQDYSGVVAGGDPSGTNLKVGDEVFGTIPATLQIKNGVGVMAEYCLASPKTCLPKPKNISFAEAAGIGLAGLTAWQSLVDSGKIQAGQRVLINGTTGGVGIFAVQIAKAKGCHVVATCSGEKADFVKQLGADETVDYKQGDLIQTLSQTYGTEDKRFDVVFDTVGVTALYASCDKYVKSTGSFETITADSSSVGALLKDVASMADFKLRPKFLGGKSIPYNFVSLKSEEQGDGLKQLAAWIEEGKLKSIVDSEHSFDRVHDAYAKIISHRAKGKVIVNVV